MGDLIIDVSNGIGRLTLNRPQARNSMPATLYGEIDKALRAFEFDKSVRVVLISGEGKHFSAGGDVKEFASTVDFTPEQRAQFMVDAITSANGLLQVMTRLPQPVVVSARGMAVGGGLAILANADLAIVSENCKMIAGQITIGGIPDMSLSYNLVRLLGVRRAKQFAFLGDTIDAQTALEMDLVNWVVADDELESRTSALVERLARTPRVALGLTKTAMNVAHTATLPEHMAQEPLDVAACVLDEDFAKAIKAMVAKITA